MTQNPPKAHVQPKQNHGSDRQSRTRVRASAETMLRDLAFVLKMTQRVRAEIEADQEAQEPSLV